MFSQNEDKVVEELLEIFIGAHPSGDVEVMTPTEDREKDHLEFAFECDMQALKQRKNKEKNTPPQKKRKKKHNIAPEEMITIPNTPLLMISRSDDVLARAGEDEMIEDVSGARVDGAVEVDSGGLGCLGSSHRKRSNDGVSRRRSDGESGGTGDCVVEGRGSVGSSNPRSIDPSEGRESTGSSLGRRSFGVVGGNGEKQSMSSGGPNGNESKKSKTKLSFESNRYCVSFFGSKYFKCSQPRGECLQGSWEFATTGSLLITVREENFPSTCFIFQPVDSYLSVEIQSNPREFNRVQATKVLKNFKLLAFVVCKIIDDEPPHAEYDDVESRLRKFKRVEHFVFDPTEEVEDFTVTMKKKSNFFKRKQLDGFRTKNLDCDKN